MSEKQNQDPNLNATDDRQKTARLYASVLLTELKRLFKAARPDLQPDFSAVDKILGPGAAELPKENGDSEKKYYAEARKLLLPEEPKIADSGSPKDENGRLKPLRPVFASLKTGADEDKDNREIARRHYYAPEPLGDKIGFPVDEEKTPFSADEYAAKAKEMLGGLREALDGMVKRFEHAETYAETYAETLHYVLMKYASRLPNWHEAAFFADGEHNLFGKGVSGDDISFFDHARLLGAVAVCLQTRANAKNNGEGNENAGKLLLIKGDLTGVQNFIYGALDAKEAGGGQKAARELRARSFYVALMTDFLARRLVERLGLAPGNLLYAGGGNFLVLADFSQKCDAQKAINCLAKALHDKADFQLSLIAGMTDFAENKLSPGSNAPKNGAADKDAGFGGVMKAVNDKLAEAKYRKQLDLLEELMLPAEIEENAGGVVAQKLSALKAEMRTMGTALPKTNILLVLHLPEFGDDEQDKAKTANCREYWVEKGKAVASGCLIPLFELNTVFYFAESPSAAIDLARGAQDSDCLKKAVFQWFYASNIEEHYNEYLQGDLSKRVSSKIPVSYIFNYAGIHATRQLHVPEHLQDREEDDDERDLYFRRFSVLSFESLARLEAPRFAPDATIEDEQNAPQVSADQISALSYPALGVVRLDVDNLGALFAYGAPEGSPVTRTAALSREFHLFFAGYINELARRHAMYVLYSGGDDAFVVGSWHNAAQFVRALRARFRDYAAGREDLTFSAGTLLCQPNTPILNMAEAAGQLEELAKGYKKPGNEKAETPDKNAVHIFNHTLSWERYARMLDFGETLLVAALDAETGGGSGKFSRSLVHRLYRMIRECVETDGDDERVKKGANLRRGVQLRYLLARKPRNYTAEALEGKTVAPGKLLSESGSCDLLMCAACEAQNDSDEKMTELNKRIAGIFISAFDDRTVLMDFQVATQFVILKTRELNK